ncbi:MAG: transketolase family protein [Candidatus Omnitrophica bacterium]|nr:transketolase family protein [Candidatus Omnitrophota bacterium]
MKLEKKLGAATRDAYGKALAELGKTHPNIVVLDGDLAKSTKTDNFRKVFPERFFNVGIAEANMVGIASGLATCGKIPFISSFACFMMCKGYDQLRMSVAFPELNVKVVASHGGISVGEDGASQQSIEDIALATSLPHFTVIVPADEVSTYVLVKKLVDHKGPVFMRTGRPKTPIIYKEGTDFQIGKGVVLRRGEDLALFAIGHLVFEALVAAEELAEKGVQASVIDLHTVKPIDRELIVQQAKATGAVVTCEEHQIYGGLGSIVSEVLAQGAPVPMELIAIRDTYAESGTPEELMDRYGLTALHIVKACERILKRKKK